MEFMKLNLLWENNFAVKFVIFLNAKLLLVTN